jgi:hypothetical protein
MADSFAKIAARTPTTVASVEIILRVVKGTPNVYEGRYSLDVLDVDGAIMDVRSGNVVPHLMATLTAGQKTALAGCTTLAQVQMLFLDFMLGKAQGII